jgi:hypothetical protein
MLTKADIAALVRHAATTFGGVFVSKGYVESSELELVAGALAVFAGVIWSIWEKRNRK